MQMLSPTPDNYIYGTGVGEGGSEEQPGLRVGREVKHPLRMHLTQAGKKR